MFSMCSCGGKASDPGKSTPAKNVAAKAKAKGPGPKAKNTKPKAKAKATPKSVKSKAKSKPKSASSKKVASGKKGKKVNDEEEPKVEKPEENVAPFKRPAAAAQELAPDVPGAEPGAMAEPAPVPKPKKRPAARGWVAILFLLLSKENFPNDCR